MQITGEAQHDVGDIFNHLDKDADRILEIEEFVTLMLEIDRRCTATDLRACFDAIDSDHDGRITREEFRLWQSKR